MLVDACSCNASVRASYATTALSAGNIQFDGSSESISKSASRKSKKHKTFRSGKDSIKPEDPPSSGGDLPCDNFDHAKVASEGLEKRCDSNKNEKRCCAGEGAIPCEDSDHAEETHLSDLTAVDTQQHEDPDHEKAKHQSGFAKDDPSCKDADHMTLPSQQSSDITGTPPCNDPEHEELTEQLEGTTKKGRKARRIDSDNNVVKRASSASDGCHFGDAADDSYLDTNHTSKSYKATKAPNAAKAMTAALDPSLAKDESGMSTQGSDFGSLPRQSGTSGMPFLKYISPSTSVRSKSPSYSINDGPGDKNRHLNLIDDDFLSESESTESETLDHNCKAYANNKQDADVPVGISRLHLVKLPALQMRPIYWSPVHDIATVTRATWFYKDTMYPVEPGVANQLEMGYRELRPWSQTWNDELNSALEVGAAGEEKISHRLWPVADDKKGGFQTSPEGIVAADPYCAARCFHGEAAAEGSIDSNDILITSGPKGVVKMYPQSHVIYKDAQNAFILKPSLQPSSYYGRRPLQKIKRGMMVGIHVVRGFDWRAWEKCHPSKKSKVAIKVAAVAPAAGAADASKRTSCAACSSLEERPKVTDLIMVIHGIGQKLSERVESFHFTHAINDFRRSVNVELCNEAVQRVMRDDLGGVMVLPVNWRSNLSFEDGGPLKDGDNVRSPSFSLRDITPETIPAVRNLISDVMLDIPFYMSHHKPKMIQAVISEANRVYRLWCKNNPEFHKEGRVHIIAHSLGSAMALEVLSKQPTSVPKIALFGKKINAKYFDFNTTNLFFCGSPAGFFLLLDKGSLTPRRGQGKPGAEKRDDDDPTITGNAGTFGCLAVDNIYNIMHYNDPIAYRLNATVDPQYAASLKNAQVPSATVGFFESIGKAMKSIAPGVSAPPELAVGQVAKPLAIARLPSQLEMEVHDFTREEKAEKKFSLLNDNCQVDWFLSSGGGPLEIQYLNMLSAHSSYWGSPDFIRMVVLECGRKPGKNNALPNMNAVKIGHKR
jgi:hypothetical protein